MAGRGPAPKKSHTRASNDVVRDSVKADGKLGGYELPDDVLPPLKADGEIQFGVDGEMLREEWHRQTVRWWHNWRASPQGVKMMTDPDWDFLLDTALMHHTMWMKGRWEFAAEIRLRVAKFGATPEDRARLKIEVEVPEQFPVGDRGQNVTSIKSRRSRITKQDS